MQPKVTWNDSSRTISLPKDITAMAAAEALYEIAKDQEQPLERAMRFQGWSAHDVAVNLNRVATDLYGYIMPSSPGFRVAVGVGESVEVFTEFCDPRKEMAFRLSPGPSLSITTKRRNENQVREFFELLEHKLRTASIYKSHAITTKWGFVALPEAEVILDAQVEAMVRANIYTPILRRSDLPAIGMTFHRGVLLAGPYGGGKTLICREASRLAAASGITSLYVLPEDMENLPTVLAAARHYGPILLVIEDIDRLTAGEENMTGMLANILDGIDTKDAEVSILLTSNHVATIPPILMRPGRIDCVIEVGLPGMVARVRLVQLYGGDRVEHWSHGDRAMVAGAQEGMSSAFIRESIARAGLYSLARGEDPSAPLAPSDVANAAAEMLLHQKLAEMRPAEPSPAEVLRTALYDVTVEACQEACASVEG